MNPENILVLIITGTAMAMDLCTDTIDNSWILLSMLSGAAERFLIRGPSGIFQAAAGVLTAFSVLFLLFVFRMLGAGDIKLFCALGAVLGPAGILRCIAGSFLAGGILSLAVLLSSRILRERILYFTDYCRNLIRTGRIVPYRKSGMNRPENIHFTIPVFLYSAFLALGFPF